MEKKSTATKISADWINSTQAEMVSVMKRAMKKTPRPAAEVAFDGFWLAPNWPALSMLEAGARAIETAGTPFTRMETAWREMRAVAVAAVGPAVQHVAGAATVVAPAGPAGPTDTERLDCLSKMGGFVRGSFEAKPAYRIMTRNTWHPTLRAAIDDAIATPPKKNEE